MQLNCKMESKIKVKKKNNNKKELLYTFTKLSGLTYQLKYQLNYS